MNPKERGCHDVNWINLCAIYGSLGGDYED
jgi:hypothetical protein